MSMIFADKLFANPVETIQAEDNDEELQRAFARIEELQKNHYLLGYIRYDSDSCGTGASNAEMPNARSPKLYFQAFADYELYQPRSNKTFSLNPLTTISYSEYAEAIAKIKAEIASGNTYEVNYTYDYAVPFLADAAGATNLADVAGATNETASSERELYEYLLNSQTTPYNAFIKNQYDTILSFSPELFFALQGRHIVTKPMKGTVRRGKDHADDAQQKNFLAADPKNRAENVMIVDLLRNDLGRIAQAGSVTVSKLFEIETHPTLHQMTSQIEADLADGITLYDIYKAIFPCGSITGAPKISTMRVIEQVEAGQRGIYCGAIGFLSPEETIFSVPIRILQRRTGSDTFVYRVGGAIVWDSDAEDEWSETVTKTRFLYGDFKLLETMALDNGTILFEQEHFTRLQKAAERYGFAYQELSGSKRQEVLAHGNGILRILLTRAGELTIEHRELAPVKQKLRISALRTAGEEFLSHKTTYRPYYREEELFFNRKGELTESSIANIVLEIDGKWYTPPLSSGLLPGIYRQKLLDVGRAEERILYREDLVSAQRVFCVNSVRGMWEVSIDFD